FKVLYSNIKSRPNVPVNQLVGSLILKHLFNWTYDELFRNLNFNILTRYAIGIRSLDEDIFSEASIFNFQNKVIEHYVQTGRDLLTEVFDKLTASQLKEFGIKSDIQRGDSFLIGSNIFDYTRLQLLIEVLLRLYRILNKKDKQLYSGVLEKYTKQTAGQYIYRIQKEELPKEIEQLAKIYHDLYTGLEAKYREMYVFEIFKRVYVEHFVIIKNKVNVIPSGELNSAILMSPDDAEATFRHKRDNGSKGYSGHISETANTDNKLNLITDIVVVPNNVDDAKILEERLPEMINKTPELYEYHADGNYGSPSVDEIMENNNIVQIQTAMRGRKAYAKMEIKEGQKGTYWVTCEQGQRVKAEKAIKGKNAKRHKAIFDYNKCLQCPLKDKCKSRIMGVKTNRPKRTWYFSDEKIRLHKRLQNINLIPEERRKLRANVEATVKEVKRGIKNGKVRIRGKERIKFYLSMTSIAVNLTRIHKYLIYNNLYFACNEIKTFINKKIKKTVIIKLDTCKEINQMNQPLYKIAI
ncbi:MAG: transposase, partial [Bacteroidales bacterium]|nr:transposase [Bacteroidales bacterium]